MKYARFGVIYTPVLLNGGFWMRSGRRPRSPPRAQSAGLPRNRSPADVPRPRH